MNKKFSSGFVIALIIAFSAVTFAITMSVSQRIYNKLITNLQNRIEAYALVDELDGIVRENYYGKIVESSKNSGMIEGYINSLHDPSSCYLSPSAYSAYLSSVNGEINGIGVNTSLDSESGYLTVTTVFDNSPAASAGIKKGDLISVIDGEEVTKKNYSQMSENLNGNKLTSVKITYIRNGKSKTVSVMMGYSSKSVYYNRVNETTGYIKIDGFYKNTSKQLKEILDGLPEEINSIIFDVRGTKDGTVQYTTDTLKLIVPLASDGSGALATEIDKNGKKTFYSSNSESLSGFSVVILVDAETSCCGELFACDIRDFDMGIIIGETTKGIADVRKSFSLSNGGGVVLTVAKVQPYITKSFDGTGIKPDLTVSNKNDLPDKDSQYDSALKYLSSQK